MTYINPAGHRKEGVWAPGAPGKTPPQCLSYPTAAWEILRTNPVLPSQQPMQRAPDCSTWTLTTIRLATLKPDSVTHIWPDFLSHLVSTEIWRFSEDPVSAQTLSGSWLSLSCPIPVTKSASGCAACFPSLTSPPSPAPACKTAPASTLTAHHPLLPYCSRP